MANTPIRELDFDQIKQSLKDYLRGQEQFKDYDFEGSTMNILLDLLSYNTHYQAFYANMVANEAFLDSAVARNSVVSLAKQLDYRPRSKKAARVVVNIQLANPNTQRRSEAVGISVGAGKEYIPAGTYFSARNALGKTVSFVTLDNYKFKVVNSGQISQQSNPYWVMGATLYEGNLKTASFIVNTKDTLQKFIIDDTSIDIDTLTLRVQRSTTDSEGVVDLWVRATDINNLNGDSKVFFVQEAENGKWEVYFGDGVVGKAVENGNLISMVYLSSNGTDGNGIGSTDSPQAPTFTTNNTEYKVFVQTDDMGIPQPSFGGTDPESIDSIKYYAPRNYQAQDRAVTADDYLSILAREYSLRSDSFLVWGGEENDPPQYGKVFISIKPKNSAKLSITEKETIANTILGKRNLLTVVPVVVDADLTYINLDITVYYNPNATTATSDVLATGVRNKVLAYSDTYLDQFGKNFRQSKFNAYVDGLDLAINSSDSTLMLEKRIEPQFERTLPYTIKFDNKLWHPVDGYPSILDSSAFYYTDLTSNDIEKPRIIAYLDDDGYGNIRIYKKVAEERIYLSRKAGTVDYTTGLVQLKSFSPLGIPDGSVEIRIMVKPDRGDIFVRRNQVLVINPNEINVSMVQEKSVIDNKASDSGFPFRA
jgi:hypothetical protein